jgi:hypothetical protein
MKLKISFLTFILVIIFNYSNIYTQDLEPTQRTFTIGGNSGQKIDHTNSYFNFDKFVLGWHWGDEYKISKALKMNQKDIYSRSTENINPNTKLFIRTNYSKTDNNRVLKQ